MVRASASGARGPGIGSRDSANGWIPEGSVSRAESGPNVVHSGFSGCNWLECFVIWGH